VKRPPIILIWAAIAFLGFGSTLAVMDAFSQEPACTQVKLAVVVDLNNDRHAPVIDHARDAVRDGQPRILHINRAEADANRVASLRGHPAREGLDRDEYPPAMADEGGQGADIRYISPRANRSAGSSMGRALEDFCTGQAFILEP
jgi:hypothetical protein